MNIRTRIAAAAVLALVALSGCPLGSQVIVVGKKCVTDDDCSSDTECVRAESANADRVCMPLDGDPANSG